MNITKMDLCNRASKKIADIPPIQLKPVLDIFLDEILNVLSEGKRIEIRGFGSFKTKNRNARVGRNPRTGDSVQIPSYTVPTFKFSKDSIKILLDKIEKKKS